MTEVGVSAVGGNVEENMQTNEESEEPKPKKAKIELQSVNHGGKLEERLNGILCCTVCLDLPSEEVHQCSNGHLMCISCLSHLLADARLKDEEATCPNCRCDISKVLCTRNLAVEKAISELPAACQFCSTLLPRSTLKGHELHLCNDRLVHCQFERLGCSWLGPHHEHAAHESVCAYPDKPGREVLQMFIDNEERHKREVMRYKKICDFLSFEKISFSDLLLKPDRSDDFISKLYYETNKFSAFNLQWVVKAYVNASHKYPEKTCQRAMSYQVILKSRTDTPVSVSYLALRGPYGEFHGQPELHEFEFTQENPETPTRDLPMVNSIECNKLLASKNISLRLILFQMPSKNRK